MAVDLKIERAIDLQPKRAGETNMVRACDASIWLFRCWVANPLTLAQTTA